jgi:hypothetical protein
VKLQFIGLLALGLLAWRPACADAPNGPREFPAPEGFKPCAPGNPLASAEAGVATKLGGEFLGCFQSERETTRPTAAKAAPMPVEYAFAIALQGGGHTPADLDNLLTTTRRQWKDFDPLSKEFKETYTARVNELIKGSGLLPSVTMVSVKPVLISIDRSVDNYYSVTSLRTYAVQVNGEPVALTRVNSDAVALQNSRLIRLTIQRTLSDPADVAQVQGEIDDWARAIAQGASPKAP